MLGLGGRTVWIANWPERPQPEHLLPWGRAQALLVPTRPLARLPVVGDTVLLGTAQDGFIGTGHVASATSPLRDLDPEWRRRAVLRYLPQTLVRLDAVLPEGRALPYEVVAYLPYLRSRRQLWTPRRPGFYPLAQLTVAEILFLLSGDFGDSSLFALAPSQRLLAYHVRLHRLNDRAALGALPSALAARRGPGHAVACESCRRPFRAFAEDQLQLHYVGSPAPFAAYGKTDFQLLCLSCHQKADYALFELFRLMSGTTEGR